MAVRSPSRPGYRAATALTVLLLVGAPLASPVAGQNASLHPVVAIVLDSAGEPVEGAIVQIEGTLGVRVVADAVSDEHGRVELRVPPGAYHAYVDSRSHPILWAGAVIVPPGRTDADPLQLRLREGATLSGRVHDAEDNPVAGAVVSLPWYFVEGRHHLDPPREARTDAHGRFELPGMPTAEEVEVRVVHPDYPHRGDEIEGWRFWVVIPPGFDGRSFRMHDVNLGRLAGTLVLDIEGAEPRASSVVLDYAGPEPGSDVVNSVGLDGPGPMILDGLRPGTWRARVRTSGGRAVMLTVALAPGHTVERRVTLPSADAGASVRVVDPRGEPVAGASVDLERGDGYADAVTDAEGRVRFDGLLAGKATATASLERRRAGSETPLPGGARYVLEELFGRVDLDVPSADTVELRLRSRRQTTRYALAGRVLGPDGSPVASAEVRLTQVRTTPAETGSTSASAETDAAGRFELADVAEGIHDVIVITARFASASRRVRVLGERPSPDLDFVLRPRRSALDAATAPGPDSRYRVRGAVHAPAGGPRPRWVSLTDAACEELVSRGEMFADGTFSVPDVRSGDWCLRIQWSNNAETLRPVRVRDGDLRVDIDMDETPRHVVAGTLTGARERAHSVTLFREEDNGMWSATVDDRGRFEIPGVPAGRYDLRVGPADRSWSLAERPLVVPSGDIELILGESRVVGTLRGPDGRPRSGSVALTPAPGEGEPVPWGGCCGLWTESGDFAFDHVPDGVWQLSASALRDDRPRLEVTPVRLVTSGGGTLTRDLQLRVLHELTVRTRTPVPATAPINIRARDPQAGDRGGDSIDVGASEARLALHPGRYELTARNEFGYERTFSVIVPGPALVLPDPVPRGRLTVLIPELFADEVGLRLEVGDGNVIRDVTAPPPLYREDDLGVARSAPLDPGTYAVRVTAEDGRTWEGTATVTAFQVTVLTLRSATIEN